MINIYKTSIKRLTFFRERNEIMRTNSEFKENIEYVDKAYYPINEIGGWKARFFVKTRSIMENIPEIT